ncbi:hypothetical protein [Ramlibacter sp. PS4R-6]|uniref:hypothetical protein n=1 Tax=Ramlibacter sp. PS4R-6 TaxID=3133438 RepID=UPI0030A3CECC
MGLRQWTLVLAAAASLGLAACHRVADKSATASPDTPVGTSGGGSGTNAMGGPGTGLTGGMNPAPGQATGVSEGSTNSTPKKSVGNR